MSGNELLIISSKGNKVVSNPEPPLSDAQYELNWANGLEMLVLQDILWNGVATTYDECVVEPDGECPHGYKSPLLLLGMI